MCDLPDDSGRTGHRAWLTDGRGRDEPFGAKHVAWTYPGKNDTHGDDRASRCCAGIPHYAEQYCNHFIAFKLLAIIRHKVFAALRKLCPAKLEGRDKGNLHFDYHNRYRTSGSISTAQYDFPDCDCSINFFDYGMLHWKIPCSGRAACTCGVSDGRRCDPDVERKARKPERNGVPEQASAS